MEIIISLIFIIIFCFGTYLFIENYFKNKKPDHICDFDYENPQYENCNHTKEGYLKITYFKCKHPGCKIFSMKDINGE